MLKYVSYDIVFQEVPDEVSLAINLSGCPNRCKGCHSPHLKEDIGQLLDKEALAGLLARYEKTITCVCFMGGDSAPQTVEQLACFIRETTGGDIKIAWYSGKSVLPQNCSPEHFNYIKLGPYREELGGLDSPSSNQHFYKIENGKMIDQTGLFRKSSRFALVS